MIELLMKKNLKFLVCALMFLGMSLPLQAATDWINVQIVSILEDGSPAASIAYVKYDKTTVESLFNGTASIYVWPAKLAKSGYTSYNKENLIGIYRDEACTQLVATKVLSSVEATDTRWTIDNIHFSDFATIYSSKDDALAAEPDILYAKFGYPKATSLASETVIIDEPYGTKTGYAWFKVANVTDWWNRELWPYTYQTGNSAYGYTTNAIVLGSWSLTSSGWARQSATYTATNRSYLKSQKSPFPI